MIFYNKNISDYFIKKILEKTDLLNLIGSELNLKKVGNSFFSLCPFHNEKKPSFSVNPIKKIYHCFGCGISGNSIKFLMDFYKLNFIESIKKLSYINNITFNYTNNNYININKKEIFFFKFLKKISDIYNINLKKNNNLNLIFFLNKKKWSSSTIKEFNLGYSSNNLISNLFINDKKKIIILEKLGIIKKINKKYIDIFNNRIIFPIYNNNGYIVSFGGRTLINNKYKYINTSNNFLFKKKYILYGLNKILNNNNIILEKLLIVEGYSDVISLFNSGINFSIASLGTSLTNEHIKIIFKNTNNIIFCYDSDLSGIKSYYRILIKIINFITDEKKVKFVILPNNEDPDSFLRKFGIDKFYEFINESKNFYDLLFELIKKDINILDINGKIKFIKKILFYVNKIPGNLTKKLVKKELISRILMTNKLNYININYKNSINKNKITLLQNIISLLLQNPKLYNLFYIPHNIKYNSINFTILINIVNLCKKYNYINFYKIISLYKNNYIYSYLYYLYKIDNKIIDYRFLDEIFLEMLNKIYIFYLRKIQSYLINKGKIKYLDKHDRKKIWLLNIELSKISYF